MSGINFAYWNSEVLKPKVLKTGREVHPSHAFGILAETLSAKRCRVLDLGPAMGDNLSFFGKYGAVIYIEDLYRSRSLSPHATGSSLLPFLQEYPERMRFDAILAWDLFNYVKLPEIKELVSFLRPYCAPQCFLLAMTSCVSFVSETPLGFRIQDEKHVEYETSEAAMKPAVPVTQRDIMKALPAWELVRSLHLRNFMQENLFRLKKGAA